MHNPWPENYILGIGVVLGGGAFKKKVLLPKLTIYKKSLKIIYIYQTTQQHKMGTL